MPKTSHSDALRDLAEARKGAMARAEEAANTTPPVDVGDYDEAECFVRLAVWMYACDLRLGMGHMPDGMALWIRLSVPTSSSDPHAGMVSFVVTDDTRALLNKAVAAMDAKPQAPWWKPDQFAKNVSG